MEIICKTYLVNVTNSIMIQNKIDILIEIGNGWHPNGGSEKSRFCDSCSFSYRFFIQPNGPKITRDGGSETVVFCEIALSLDRLRNKTFEMSGKSF